MDDQIAETPNQRALRLLHSFLTERQTEELARYQGFLQHKRDRLYWISLKASPVCAFPKKGVIQRYCIQTTDRTIPAADRALTYLTWINSAPDKFHKWANLVRTFPFPRFDSEHELYMFLAHQGGSIGRGASPYSYLPTIQEPPLTPEQREYGLAQARRLKTELRIAMLRDRLALVDLGDQPILERLAEEWPFEKKSLIRR